MGTFTIYGRADQAARAFGQRGSLASGIRNSQFPSNLECPHFPLLLVGKPQLDGMNDAFEKALGILEKAPTPTEIVTEEGVTQFLDKFEDLVSRHLD